MRPCSKQGLFCSKISLMTPKTYTTPLGFVSLVGELGLIISLPLLVGVLIGMKLDKWLGYSPLFLIIGMMFAALISILLIWRKVKAVSEYTKNL